MGDNAATHVLETVVVNELGLHARAAARVAEIAARANSNVWLVRGDSRVDASSVIDMLTLACVKGTKIRFEVEHQADIPLLKQLMALVENRFGEQR
jgi:phosphocarrier protein